MSRCNATTLRKASRYLSGIYDTVLAPSGLRATQFAILAELNRNRDKPLLMTELARAMAMDRTTLGRNLRPLERDGFVTLSVDDDRRGRRIILTARGYLKVEEMTPLWERAQQRFESAFGKERAAQLRELATMVLTLGAAHLLPSTK
jgi:DNA-binding MarR family transcriptional regulator